jgi:hypothetical protein
MQANPEKGYIAEGDPSVGAPTFSDAEKAIWFDTSDLRYQGSAAWKAKQTVMLRHMNFASGTNMEPVVRTFVLECRLLVRLVFLPIPLFAAHDC